MARNKLRPTKPYFRYKGRYMDGRKRMILEWEINGEIHTMPVLKPEKLWDLMARIHGRVDKSDFDEE